MPTFVRVQAVSPTDSYRARVVFTNGETREVDLTPYIATGAVFEPVRTDPIVFRAMRVEGGTIAWPNGADIDPDVLYYAGVPPWAEQSVQIAAESHDQHAL